MDEPILFGTLDKRQEINKDLIRRLISSENPSLISLNLNDRKKQPCLHPVSSQVSKVHPSNRVQVCPRVSGVRFEGRGPRLFLFLVLSGVSRSSPVISPDRSIQRFSVALKES